MERTLRRYRRDRLRTNDSTVRGFTVINFPDEGIEIDGTTGFGDSNFI